MKDSATICIGIVVRALGEISPSLRLSVVTFGETFGETILKLAPLWHLSSTPYGFNHFRVLGFKAKGLGLRAQGLRLRAWGLGLEA